MVPPATPGRKAARAAACLAMAGAVLLPPLAAGDQKAQTITARAAGDQTAPSIAAPAAGDPRAPSIAERVETVLESKLADSERILRLENLGSDAIPVLLALLGNETVPFTNPESAAANIDGQTEALIVAALKRFDRVHILPPLVGATAKAPSARLRRSSAEILGAVGDRRDLPLLCRIVSPAEPNDDIEPQAAPAFRQAVVEILRRDFTAYLTIQDVLRGQRSATRLALYRALADSGSSQAMPVLVQRLGADSAEDPLLLAEISRASRLVPLPPEIGVREALRPYLHSGQATLIRAATTSLGNLEDPGCVVDLIEQLGHPDSFVRESSHAALCRITGEKLLPDQGRWAAWYASECEWYKNRAQACVEDLRTEVSVRKHVAISEISRHALYREEFTVDLLRMLPRESEALQRLGICALGLMGSTSAVPFLEAMASDANPVLATEARGALTRIQGRRPQPENRTAPLTAALSEN